MSALSFASEVDAFKWARRDPRGNGRVYMIAFPEFFKVGSSQAFYGRLSNYRQWYPTSHLVMESIIIGPVSPEFRALEKLMHSILPDAIRHRGDSGGKKEWYIRHPAVEQAVAAWIAEGYSETLLPAIELAVTRQPAALPAPQLPDPKLPCTSAKF